jgi:hypothetical protein
MFGIGKKRLHIGQFSRHFQQKIYDLEPRNIDFMDKEMILTDRERNVLNADIFVFRFCVYNILLLRTAILKRTKRDAQDLGYIGTYSLKLALDDKGVSTKHINEIEGIYLKQMDKLTELLSTVDITTPDMSLIESITAMGFTKYFAELFGFATPNKPNGELDISNYKEAVVMHVALFVFNLVSQSFNEEYANFKITDL